jgi:hypothetical protein
MAASVIAPLLLWYYGPKFKFTPAETFILGTLLFLCLSVIELVYYVAGVAALTSIAAMQLRSEQEIDSLLVGIRDGFNALTDSGDSGRVFRHHFQRALEEQRGHLWEAASTGALAVNQRDLHLSDAVLDCFGGGGDDVIRVIHRLSQNAQILGPHEAQWLMKVHQRARSGKVREVRRLFLYEDVSQLSDPVSLQLIGAHARERRYDYRLMATSAFQELSEHYGLGQYIDFGVYGKYYVFVARRYDGQEFDGQYVGTSETLAAFTRFFDDCWRAGQSYRADAFGLALPKDRLDQLLRVPPLTIGAQHALPIAPDAAMLDTLGPTG